MTVTVITIPMKRKKRSELMSERGKLIVVCGPSGVGKGTVVSLLKTMREFYFSVSVTTRAPRDGEIDGVNYCFITKQKFDDMVENNELLEHATYVSSSYGTPRAPVEAELEAGHDVLLEIELEGARQIKRAMPEAVLIFILPPSTEELARRLRGRGTETEEKIINRLKRAEYELTCADEFDYQVVNDEVECAANRICDIINNIKINKE